METSTLRMEGEPLAQPGRSASPSSSPGENQGRNGGHSPSQGQRSLWTPSRFAAACRQGLPWGGSGAAPSSAGLLACETKIRKWQGLPVGVLAWGAGSGARAGSRPLGRRPWPHSRETSRWARDALALRAQRAPAWHLPPSPLSPPQGTGPQAFRQSSTQGWCGPLEDPELLPRPPPTLSVPGHSAAHAVQVQRRTASSAVSPETG